MDYCSSCRRHLNGALVCPGCGAYAPDIAPLTTGGHTVPARAATAARGPATGRGFANPNLPDMRYDEDLADEAAFEDGAVDHPRSEAPGGPGAPHGRAARRRQRARWKKSQRRAVVATAVALVGGGLTFASMDRHSADRAQAAAAPDVASMGGADGQAPEPPVVPTLPGTQRSAHPSPSQSPATGLPRHGSAAPGAPTTSPDTRPDSVPVTRTALTTRTAQSAAQQQPVTAPSAAAPVTAPSHAAPAPSQTAAPAPSGGTDAGTSQPAPAPTATSPSHLCLLVLCLG
ncbi:SCO2400 family protein [Streptomyces sp. NPDC004096]|uniref:SCO2400 family protein n=1 Tax=unclassified Streptomyces TaxID=2593676 RepID=UPI0033B0E03F